MEPQFLTDPLTTSLDTVAKLLKILNHMNQSHNHHKTLYINILSLSLLLLQYHWEKYTQYVPLK